MRFIGTLGRYRYQTTAVFTAVVVVVFVLIFVLMAAPVDSGSPEYEFVIGEGLGAKTVAQMLEDDGIIRSAFLFKLYASITGRTRLLKAGRYLLCPCDSALSTLHAISSGDALSDDIVITIPEGMNGWELDLLFAENGLSRKGELRERFVENEGMFFPDTYRIGKTEDGENLVERMRSTSDERLSEYTREQIIIASMLEKEAKTEEDMALVAGVILRRMEIDMLLQIDATVGYGWCIRTRGVSRLCDVTQAPIAHEIDVDGPYNTYMRSGLPAGPISNPGIKALQAATNPKYSDYLFYLSTRDGSRLIFSKTNEEHLRNRRKYLGF